VCKVAPVKIQSFAKVAPENDNKNMAKGGESNADGEGFPLLWVNGAIVERPKKGAKTAPAAAVSPVPAPKATAT
jgi:hypothetical protein